MHTVPRGCAGPPRDLALSAAFEVRRQAEPGSGSLASTAHAGIRPARSSRGSEKNTTRDRFAQRNTEA
eukprot:6206879-Pleurochrysis_carterae.AAC.1